MSNNLRHKKKEQEGQAPSGWTPKEGNSRFDAQYTLGGFSLQQDIPQHHTRLHDLSSEMHLMHDGDHSFMENSSHVDRRNSSLQQRVDHHQVNRQRFQESTGQQYYPEVQQQQDSFYQYLKTGNSLPTSQLGSRRISPDNEIFARQQQSLLGQNLKRPQAQSVLATQNLNSKPKDQQVSIEQVIQKQIDKKINMQSLNQTAFDYAPYQAQSRFTPKAAYISDLRTQGSIINAAMTINQKLQGSTSPDSLTMQRMILSRKQGRLPNSDIADSIGSSQQASAKPISEDEFNRAMSPSDLRFRELLLRKQFECERQKTIGERGSASLDHRRQPKASGYDQKQKVLVNKDAKNINEMLSYKDYAMEGRAIFSNQSQRASTRGGVTSDNFTDSHTNQDLFQDQQMARIIKNTFNPQSTQLQGHRGSVGPLAHVKIPDTLKEALYRNGDTRDLVQRMIRQQNQTALSPKPWQDRPELLSRGDDKEFVIKNYRLIHQKRRDFFLPTAQGLRQSLTRSSAFTPQDAHRSLKSPTNQIRVANSILSPNTYHFSTKINVAHHQQHEKSDLQVTQEPSIITAELTSPQSPREYMNLLKQMKPQRSHEVSEEKQQQPEFVISQSPEKVVIRKVEEPLLPDPIRILESTESLTEDSQVEADIMQKNFNDVISSWLGYQAPGISKIQSDVDDIEQDLKDRMARQFSEVEVYDHDNSFDSLEVEKKMILKMKPQKDLPFQIKQHPGQVKGETTGREPYGHLKARNVFERKNAEFNGKVERALANPDSLAKAQDVIELTKGFLTHLDYSQFTIDNLPLEIFDDFIIEAETIKQRMARKKNGQKSPLKAKTQYFRVNGDIEQVQAEIIEYNESLKKFVIEFEVDGKTVRKNERRLNLVFDEFDSKENIEERRLLAVKLRRHALFKLNAERLFVHELARKYDYIKMPILLKHNIKKKLGADLASFDSHKVQNLVLQVEALFVFSILKSIIHSQIGDPFISRIVAQYNIEDTTLTDKDVKAAIADEVHVVPYNALKAYEENGGKLERMLNKDEARMILQDYGILGKKSFIEAIQFLIQQNEDLVIKTPMFEFPITEQKLLIHLQSQDEFKSKSIEDLKGKLKSFPVQMHHFVKSQRIMARRFKETLEGRWTENIAKKIEQILDKEFKLNSDAKEILRSQLNPYVLKLLELIRLFQERNLHDKLMDTMEGYLKFLLQFAIRDQLFTESRIYHSNEYDSLKVRMSRTPMIIVEVRVRKNMAPATEKVPSNTVDQDSSARGRAPKQIQPSKMYVYEIQTKPPLEDVWTDLNSMVDMFGSSVSRIKRIDDMVIPQLKMKRTTLMQLEKSKNQKLTFLTKLITTLIDSMRAQPDARVASFQQYAPYLEMTFDSIILDLKMKTYGDQQSIAESMDEDKKNQSDFDEEEELEKEESIQMDIYKDVEISEVVYIQKFTDLRQAYWDLLLSVDNTYDYGMIVLDCESFKTMVSRHIEKLLKGLEKHIVEEFLLKMNSLYSQFEIVEKKATDQASTIDDVILLIEFIENIQKPDELLDDLEHMMEELKSRKNFVDELYLRLEDSDYEKYLNLFSFPSKLRMLLVKRKFSLENEREVLSAQMAQEKEKVLKSIIYYRECFEYFKKVGLYKPGGTLFGFPSDDGGPNADHTKRPEVKNIIKKKVVQDSGPGSDPNRSERTGNESARGANKRKRSTIVQLSDDQGNQFVPQYISENSARMDKLRYDLEGTEQECEIINRREKLLNFRITKFTAVSNLKSDMAPFITLWSIAQNFTKVYENWLHGSFQDLDSDNMDEMLQDWIKQLTRISKTNLATYDQPLLLVNYLLRELERFKEYMPMITSMRARGLEKRHWYALAKQLNFEHVDTAQMTLANLIEMKLHEGNQLDIIKAVCEVAMREWAIKSTLDSLEAELKNVEFTVSRYKEPNTAYILKGLEELMIGFEEFTIKVVGLKSNAFAKPFAERIQKVEREFRTVVDVLDEWMKTQKSWIYLEPIFSQKDLAKQMVAEASKFNSLDNFYKKEINNIRADLQVHKYCRREHILSQLQYVNKEFENISKGLTVYLESKREHFARFYFLSNEEIIEILGQMRDPRNVQRYLNKIFEGIEYLQFTPYGMIAGAFSREDEYLVLRKMINPTDTAESWLRELENEMKHAVKHVIQCSFLDFRMKDFESWVKAWQGQAVLVVLNIIFTETLTQIFQTGQTKRLKDVQHQVVFEIETLTKMIRTKVDLNTRTSICSLLTNRVHARDTLQHMTETDACHAADFYWKLHMKYEYMLNSKKNIRQEQLVTTGLLESPMKKELSDTFNLEPVQKPASNHISVKDGEKEAQRKQVDKLEHLQELYVSMIDASKPYGYEYLGNTSRIVVTPLTDRCFRALFMALHFNYGGSPEGPVGTGKTETTKDLSKCLGKQCFVFNCSSSLNYEAMSKFFKGLATSGAWSCFDEFNRIDLSVLSVISQIIIVMQGAIRENKTDLILEDTHIKFNKECAIFITMNPQFLGRTDLPDNLKSLFRPIAMIIPDSTLISEILLYSSGFLQAKPLARKLVRAFKLAQQQLSNQIHYEFGLRSIKIVLQIAALMKLKASGVIEPDFKIKEGKKLKVERDYDDDSPKKGLTRQNRMTRNDNNKQKKLDQNNRTHYLNYMRKQESSLDSEDMIKRRRQRSIDSDDLGITDKSFFKKVDAPQPNKRLDDIREEKRLAAEKLKKQPEQILKKVQLQCHKVTNRGLAKFQTRRKAFARGSIDMMMDKRLDTLEEFKDEAKVIKKLMKVLGIDNEELIHDEKKIEEFIVLRAINDTNLPKLHQNDTAIFKGIINDIFPQPIKQSTKRSSLKSLLEDVIQSKNLHMTEDIMERVLHLYETVMIRHGVMVVGSTMTGKTTSIQLLQECLNRSRENELEERIQEFKVKKAKKLALKSLGKKQWQDDTYDQDELRALNVELTFEEMKIAKSQCRNKGVATFTINPKSLTIDQLMGVFDASSHDWTDGIMAHAMRTCSQDTSERRNWIVFDGPIDPIWVENLNSVLDDNKKLTLSTGESIKMTGLMTVILEAEDLSNCTPATISRCGMIYMKDDILPLKAIINQWIKKMPVFLEDIASELDQLVNYFIPDILEKYMHVSNLIYPVSKKWAVKNFCRLMDAMINDYRSEKFNQLNTLNAAALALYTNPGSALGRGATGQLDDDLPTTESKQQTNPTGKRPFHLQFSDIESRFQCAFRHKSMWLQNFFLFSLIWGFGSILQLNLRADFENDIKAKIICNTQDISTIAQLKSKFNQKKSNSVYGVTPTAAIPVKITPARNTKLHPSESQTKILNFHPTSHFKEPEKPPYFLCTIPVEFSLFDIYFDLESNQWYPWDSLKISNRGGMNEDSSNNNNPNDPNNFKRYGSIFTKFIPTIETIRLGYIIEAHIVSKNNLMLIGPTGCGKSWLTREILFKHLPMASSRYKSSSMVFSSASNAEKAQHFIDSRIEKRRKGVYGPPFSQKFVFFIDDIMMPFKDEYGTQSANELLRQWFDFQGWFDSKSLEFKKIEDIQFLSCVTIYDAHKTVISPRNEWHWAYLGTLTMDERHYSSMFAQILEHYAIHWPLAVQGTPMKNAIKATLDLYAFFEKNVKPTPSKYLYHFNIRHMFKIIYGMTEVEHTYLRTEFQLAQLWIHESWRTMCDRIVDVKDQKMIFKKLNELGKKYFKLGDNKFSKKRGNPFFSPFNKGFEGLYTEVTSISESTAYIKKYLAEYNEQHKKQRIDVVIFDFLVEFLLKILRVIRQPFSHAILIGIEGSGWQPLCQLATSLANFQYYTIHFDAHYSQEDWQIDLKHMLQTAGIEQKEVVFHFKHNEIIKEQFLDDLNTLVNNGDIQNLFSKEEYENIIAQVSAKIVSTGAHSTDVGSIVGPNKQTHVNGQIALGDFSSRCRENLKVVLNFTPTGANLRQRVRDFKQLLNCSTVIWMENWPNEGYKEVAETLLPLEHTISKRTENLFTLNRDQVLEIALKIHMDAIALSKTYFFETQHFLHITPHLFQDFITTYKTLYNEKRSNLNDMRRRYGTGLERLKSTSDLVETFQSQLEGNSPLLIDKQIEIEKILERLREDQENVGRLKDILSREEQQLSVQREQAIVIRDECEHRLETASPELFEAIAAIQSLSKVEINELKSLKNPPTAIKLLMEGICLVMGVEPVRYKAKDGVTILKDYWSAATGKYVLGNLRLVEILTDFDSSTITSDKMVELEEIIENQEFKLDTVSRASKAGRGLFMWLQSIKNYYYVYQETTPKRDALFFAEKQMVEKEREIKRKQAELSELQSNLIWLKDRHEILKGEISILQTQIDQCSVRKERAGKLLIGLGGERQKWLVCNRMIEKKFETIQGDVLIGAAFITYLSGFTQKFREQSVESWSKIIKRQGINLTDDFSFNKNFGDQIKIKEWTFNGLPSDSFSIQNAVILEKCSKQPICIDPQYQASKWLKKQDAKDLKVLNFSDANFSQQLEFAIKFGKKVIIENVGQKIELILYPLIRKEYQNEGGIISVNLFGHQIEMDSLFRLVILSELKNPRFGPDVSVLTTQVNFHVTIEGLEEQMLSIVITNQKNELEEESIRLRREALVCIKNLKQLEDEILESLNRDIEEILADEKLILTLENSKKTSRLIGENLQRVNRTSVILLKSRGIYTPAAYRAAILYFLVSDISKIESMYQFSLKWYIDIFTEEVKSKKHTDQDPLLDIIRNFTYTLYRKVCQSIFEKDKLFFTFLLAFRILDGEKCLNDKLFDFFLKGAHMKTEKGDDEEVAKQSSAILRKEDSNLEEDDSSKYQREAALKNRILEVSHLQQDDRPTREDRELKKMKKAVTWISESQWEALDTLAQIPPFSKPSIVKHILENQDLWQTYINAKDSDNIQMPAVYAEYDPEREERLKRKKMLQKAGILQGDGLDQIDEDTEDPSQREMLGDDEIWNLDDSEDEQQTSIEKTQDMLDNVEAFIPKMNQPKQIDEDKFIDDRETYADTIVSGVSDYQEVRYGSIRFEKELHTKKLQVLKDLIRFSIIRIFTPHKIVSQVQRFLGSVVDPRFMEPPVFNLPSFYQETNCTSPNLFIQSPNTNVFNELNILRNQLNDESITIEYMPLGGNIKDKVLQLIFKCATKGCWLLLENLHLVIGWIPVLEKYLQEMYKEDRKQPVRQSLSNRRVTQQSRMSMPKDIQPVPQPSGQSSATFPELQGIKIHPKFRLWLSSMPVDYFPVSFLQDCIKITLQPAQGIRQNAQKILNSTNSEFLQRCPQRQPEFRKLFFALTIFHAVVVDRQRFGPLGFSAPSYKFSENDFVISSLQLEDLISKLQGDTPLPLDLARYLIGTLNYGGRVIKSQDEITLKALLETFINDRASTEQNYRLTGADNTVTEQGIYYIPGEGDLNHYKMFIGKFPMQDRPEIFGLHKNAIVQRMTNDGRNLLERVFEFEFASKEITKATAILETNDAGIHEDDNESKHDDKNSTFKKRIITVMQELPNLLDEKLCSQMFPISYDHCFNTLITKEIQRYNILMQVIYLSMKNTLKALEGLIHINSQLEEVHRSLTYEHVPHTWYKYSYPTYKSLGLFLHNLKQRVAFINSFLTAPNRGLSLMSSDENVSAPISYYEAKVQNYWLPGFFDQEGFLTMLLQQKARLDKISIEHLTIDYRVVKESQAQAIEYDDGCLVHGLHIEAASWHGIDEIQNSHESMTLQDQPEGQGISVYQEMPHMHLRVITQSEFDQKYDNDNYYHCPLYMISLRDCLDLSHGGENAAFTEGLVTKIPLYIGASGITGAKGQSAMRSPAFWIKRGTALICHIDD